MRPWAMLAAFVGLVLGVLAFPMKSESDPSAGQDLKPQPCQTNVLVEQDESLADLGIIRLRLGNPEDILEITGGRPALVKDGATLRIHDQVLLKGVCRIRPGAGEPLILQAQDKSWTVRGGHGTMEMVGRPPVPLAVGQPVAADAGIALRVLLGELGPQASVPSSFTFPLNPPKSRGVAAAAERTFLVYEPDPVTPWQASGKERPLSFSGDGALQEAELLVMGFEKAVRIPVNTREVGGVSTAPGALKPRKLVDSWILPTRITVVATVTQGKLVALPQEWKMEGLEIQQQCEHIRDARIGIPKATASVFGSSGILISGSASGPSQSSGLSQGGVDLGAVYWPLPSEREFVAMLQDRESVIRRVAAVALGEIAGKGALDLLRQALAKEEDPDARQAILDALEKVERR